MERFDAYEWIRRQVEAELHFPLTDAMWQDLTKRGTINNLAMGNLSLSSVVDEIYQLLNTYGSPVPVLDMSPAMLSEDLANTPDVSAQDAVRSRIVADLVGQHEGVVAFRAAMFGVGGDLLKWAEVEGWIEEQRKSAMARQPQVVMDDIPVPPAYLDILTTEHRSDDDGPALQIDLTHEQVQQRARPLVLRYASPSEGRERQTFVPQGAPALIVLYHLAAHFAHTIPWTEAQASVFILTGIPPLITRMRGQFERSDPPEFSRLYMTIDPALSPREVAEGYQKMRQQLIGGRHRDITEKHAQLAYFAVTRMKGQSLAARMAEWNRLHPDWAYSRANNFSRDMVQAQRRLLGAVAAGQSDRYVKAYQIRDEHAEIVVTDGAQTSSSNEPALHLSAQALRDLALVQVEAELAAMEQTRLENVRRLKEKEQNERQKHA